MHLCRNNINSFVWAGEGLFGTAANVAENNLEKVVDRKLWMATHDLLRLKKSFTTR